MSMDQVIGGMQPGSYAPIASMPPMDNFEIEETGLNDQEIDQVRNRIWGTQDNYNGMNP